jgi:choline dehydrogenase
MVHPATAPKAAPQAFDFIVVGGGTAGCVVAGRLAENPKVSVLVIEAGKRYLDSSLPDIFSPYSPSMY